MAARVLARETLAAHGELRAYLLEDGATLLVEVLREADGRAWQLRLPLAERAGITRLLRATAHRLRVEESPVPGPDGSALLGEIPLGTRDGLVAVVLAEGEERALALWRRERLRDGWSWTIAQALVPLALGLQLATGVESVLAGLDLRVPGDPR